MNDKFDLKHIYYRGTLRSCNYNCSYCPFRSQPLPANVDRDRLALERFCLRVPELGQDLSVMFVPRGEALIHSYYWEAMANLCDNKNIRMVGCQTNLSFSVQRFALKLADCLKKVRLWCSFHPSQVGVNDFVAQCDELRRNEILFCVGAVGDPHNLDSLTDLRKQLPNDIYFWINSSKRHHSEYTPKEINAFISIDPLFSLETTYIQSDSTKCSAGKTSLLIEADGSAYACNISKIRLGNIYNDNKLNLRNLCISKECSCYLAYANRTDIPELSVFGENVVFRLYSHIQTKSLGCE